VVAPDNDGHPQRQPLPDCCLEVLQPYRIEPYVRKKVPIDLRHLYNGDQVRKSLETGNESWRFKNRS
jgi:hypothetical protein